jgi:hypothetical protein
VINQGRCVNQCIQPVKGYASKPCLGGAGNAVIAFFAGCCIDLWFCLSMLPVVMVAVVMLPLLLLLVMVVVVVY